MNVERQTNGGYQLDLFEDWVKPLCHGARGEGGTGPAAYGEQQAFTASEGKRALATHLMERVAERMNLLAAYRKVKGNRGAPGVDGMRVDELGDWLLMHHREMINT